jgi:hypothetical protein
MDKDAERRLLTLVARLEMENHRLACEGAFSLDREPYDLMPAISAYAAEEISGDEMAECIRRWLSGVSFCDPKERDWEPKGR